MPTGMQTGTELTLRAHHHPRRYWLCLLQTEPDKLAPAAQTAWGAAAAVYQSITLVASLLSGANVHTAAAAARPPEPSMVFAPRVSS